MRVSRWKLQDESFKVRASRWEFQDEIFKMRVSSWEFQDESFKMSVSRWWFQDQSVETRVARWEFQDLAFALCRMCCTFLRISSRITIFDFVHVYAVKSRYIYHDLFISLDTRLVTRLELDTPATSHFLQGPPFALPVTVRGTRRLTKNNKNDPSASSWKFWLPALALVSACAQ